MNGIIVADKPAGFTSFDVVAKMRGICQTRQIGHGGTLDPMATGVLPIFVGRAAKAVDLAPNQDKGYEAIIRFGIGTDTGDITGAVLRQSNGQVSADAFAAVLPRFVGPQQQLPPLYSAVKVNGKPLYKYAREGAKVERKPRSITIYSLAPLGAQGENLFALRVACSKGTYIRTLAEDIGEALGMPATLAALRRVQAGVFGKADCHTLEEIQVARDEGRLDSLVRPVDVLFEALPALRLPDEALPRLLNGAPVYRAHTAPGRWRAYCDGMFIGLVCTDEEGTARVEKLFFQPEAGNPETNR